MERERLVKLETHMEHILEELKRNSEQHKEIKELLEKLDNKYAPKRIEAIVYAFAGFFFVCMFGIVLSFMGLK